jgi:class 3 adenylate cyclase
METPAPVDESHASQLRLLLEELCCDLCRFEHIAADGLLPENVHIAREYHLGAPGLFADIRVSPGDLPPYFVEIKFGYSTEAVLKHLRRKYKNEAAVSQHGSKIILVIDAEIRPEWQTAEVELRKSLPPGLELQVWDKRRLLGMLRERFGVEVEAITAENLLDVRQTIDQAKGFHAFGGDSLAEYEHDPLNAALTWHFGFWRLRHLREPQQKTAREIFPPGMYRGVVVLFCDLCSFSSYVRDTPDNEIIRESLTSFYSKARYQIINSGGMLYQFVGDEVIAFYGIPDHREDAVRAALATARALVSIGNSVSNHWQRRIDRVQTSGGVHLGMSIGDLQIVSLQPFSRTHVGAIGDCINVAARLMTVAGASELAVTNSLYEAVDDETQALFREVEPVEARNVGRIKAWKLNLAEGC